MLQGKGRRLSDGKFVYIQDYDNPKLALDPLGSIVCPICGGVIFPKAGPVRIKHFSHMSGHNCVDPYPSDGLSESPEHFFAKYHYFKKLRDEFPASDGHTVDIEVAIPEIKRRADILLSHKEGWSCAYEIQLSEIPLDDILARTESYRSAGIGIRWLLGKNLATNHRYIDYVSGLVGDVMLISIKPREARGSFIDGVRAWGF